MVVYIAGPYRAIDPWRTNLNIHNAECVATIVWEIGHYPLCPHTNARYASSYVSDAQYLAGTMEFMRRSDAVIVLPDFQKSEGTLGEIAEARRLGMPVAFLGDLSTIAIKNALLDVEHAIEMKKVTIEGKEIWQKA